MLPSELVVLHVQFLEAGQFVDDISRIAFKKIVINPEVKQAAECLKFPGELTRELVFGYNNPF
jgi:hypothetical protein